MSTVIGTADHPVDLHDGRMVAPGETVADVDTSHPHQRSLVTDGHLTVVEGKTPRTAPSGEQVRKAAVRDATADKETRS